MKQNADYDVVGQYAQDAVNGFSNSLLEGMIELVDPQNATKILDAMGGNGNLTHRLYEYCQRKNIKMPHCTLFEISQVQTEFAKTNLPSKYCDVICGDILNLTSFDKDKVLEEGGYDCVMIKSANHEIPLKDQERLYRNIFSLLKPGGYFVNLGFLFDNLDERDEMRMLARVKDKLAGMKQAEKRRHFLMRDEFYQRLEKVGFVSVQAKTSFNYRNSSKVVADNYFSKSRTALDIEYRTAHEDFHVLRKNGLIEFKKDEAISKSPGEITFAVKPPK
jgi:SAM-dependent methyltransferase